MKLPKISEIAMIAAAALATPASQTRTIIDDDILDTRRDLALLPKIVKIDIPSGEEALGNGDNDPLSIARRIAETIPEKDRTIGNECQLINLLNLICSAGKMGSFREAFNTDRLLYERPRELDESTATTVNVLVGPGTDRSYFRDGGYVQGKFADMPKEVYPVQVVEILKKLATDPEYLFDQILQCHHVEPYLDDQYRMSGYLPGFPESMKKAFVRLLWAEGPHSITEIYTQIASAIELEVKEEPRETTVILEESDITGVGMDLATARTLYSRLMSGDEECKKGIDWRVPGQIFEAAKKARRRKTLEKAAKIQQIFERVERRTSTDTINANSPSAIMQDLFEALDRVGLPVLELQRLKGEIKQCFCYKGWENEQHFDDVFIRFKNEIFWPIAKELLLEREQRPLDPWDDPTMPPELDMPKVAAELSISKNGSLLAVLATAGERFKGRVGLTEEVKAERRQRQEKKEAKMAHGEYYQARRIRQDAFLKSAKIIYPELMNSSAMQLYIDIIEYDSKYDGDKPDPNEALALVERYQSLVEEIDPKHFPSWDDLTEFRDITAINKLPADKEIHSTPLAYTMKEGLTLYMTNFIGLKKHFLNQTGGKGWDIETPKAMLEKREREDEARSKAWRRRQLA